MTTRTAPPRRGATAAQRALRAGAADTAAAEFSLAVQYPVETDAPTRAQVRRWIAATLAALPAPRTSVFTVRFVGSREGRALNLAHRGRDYATNVLTFNLHEDAPRALAATLPVMADIVVCLPVVKREAREQKKPMSAHLAHMIVHGTLHAHGYDHQNDAQAGRMEALERAVLARFRIADPYQ